VRAEIDQQTSNGALNLPALKSLGELSQYAPVIAVDSREKEALQFPRLRTIRKTLGEGDYQIVGISDFSVERKASLDELSGCCMGTNRERFERELFRLRPYSFKRLIIVGATCDEDVLTYRYFSRIAPKAVLSSLYGWQASFQIPFVLVPTPEQAALMIEKWVFYWCRHKVKEANELLRELKAQTPEAAPDQSALSRRLKPA
jgi:ERCC4-type nuclease